jgi:hypothetical protein
MASRSSCGGHVLSLVEQHPKARDRLPQGAGGEAHLGEVLGGEGDRDHGRAISR